MKALRIFFNSLVIASALTLFTNCSPKEESIKDVAKKYMEASYKSDFESAAALCGEELKETLAEFSASFARLHPAVQERIKALSEEVDIEIKEPVNTENEGIYTVECVITIPTNSGEANIVQRTLELQYINDIWVITKQGDPIKLN